MMLQETVFNNRVYVFKEEDDWFSPTLDFFNRMFKAASLSSPEEVKFICSGFDYDAYSVKCSDGKDYFVKYSLDRDNKSLAREFASYLNTCPDQIISHGEMSYGGDVVVFSIVLHLFAPSIKEVGVHHLSDIDGFVEYYNSVSEIKESDVIPSVFDKINEWKTEWDLSSFLPYSKDAIKENYNIEIINDCVCELNNFINGATKSLYVSEPALCHGNLKPSNILIRGGRIKFIDYNDCFIGSKDLDLSLFCLKIGASKAYKESLFKAVYGDAIEEQKPYIIISEEIAKRKVFLDCLFGFLKEVFVYDSKRLNKLMEHISIYASMEKDLRTVQFVQKHIEFFNDLFMGAIVGKMEFNG